MAKKRSKKKAGRVGKKRRAKAGVSQAQRAAVGARRAQLHRAASLLKDFHGGKLPLKSGCGRPRTKRRK